MRKLFAVILISVLLLGLAPSALAQGPSGSIAPDPAFVPHEVMSDSAEFAATFGSNTFADLWVDVDQLPWGSVVEVPGSGAADAFLGPNVPGQDDLIRGIESNFQVRGFPFGFTFHYMQGPPRPVEGWEIIWCDYDGDNVVDPGELVPPWFCGPGYPAYLADEGYTRAYIAINGFIVFDDPEVNEWVYEGVQGYSWIGLGQWNWWPWQIPIAEPPNNFIAPYWTDLTVDDNRYWRVEDVCWHQAAVWECIAWDPNGACVAWGWVLTPETGVWEPCAWSRVFRPAGRLLVTTLGEEPNRVWVVEWLNARNVWTGNLCTFELQLYEGSNAILFLYEDFQTKDAGGPYFEIPSVLTGGEDYFATSVGHFGEVYQLPGRTAGLPGPPWNSGRFIEMVLFPKNLIALPWWVAPLGVPQPMAAGTMRGFIY